MNIRIRVWDDAYLEGHVLISLLTHVNVRRQQISHGQLFRNQLFRSSYLRIFSRNIVAKWPWRYILCDLCSHCKKKAGNASHAQKQKVGNARHAQKHVMLKNKSRQTQVTLKKKVLSNLRGPSTHYVQAEMTGEDCQGRPVSWLGWQQSWNPVRRLQLEPKHRSSSRAPDPQTCL
jgi:hypothetical protein